MTLADARRPIDTDVEQMAEVAQLQLSWYVGINGGWGFRIST